MRNYAHAVSCEYVKVMIKALICVSIYVTASLEQAGSPNHTLLFLFIGNYGLNNIGNRFGSTYRSTYVGAQTNREDRSFNRSGNPRY
jgi:hypothetical protein